MRRPPEQGVHAATSHYRNENFPGSAQTQVTGLNNGNITVGFWVDKAGDNSGFYSIGGRRFHTADYPTANPAKPAVDQLLGVNDSGIAVGFYTDGKGANHGYSYNISTRMYRKSTVTGDTNVTAAAINNLGDIAGFATNGAGTTEAFLKLPNGDSSISTLPGATTTQAFGVNDGDEVVGDYTVTGSSATTTGFVWSPGFGFESINDPNGDRRDDDQRRQRPRRTRRLLHRRRQHPRVARHPEGRLISPQPLATGPGRWIVARSRSVPANLAQIDDLGGTRKYNHHPTGWAMAFKMPSQRTC